MKIVAKTNVLLRAVLPDEGQRDTALNALRSAELVAVSVHSLCEFSWVLERRYGADRAQIGAAIRMLVDTSNVVVNRPAVSAGVSVLDAGGDSADGVIGFDGRWLGDETFISFDKKALKLLDGKGPRSVFCREPVHNRRVATITARLDHDVFSSNRAEDMNVIDFK